VSVSAASGEHGGVVGRFRVDDVCAGGGDRSGVSFTSSVSGAIQFQPDQSAYFGKSDGEGAGGGGLGSCGDAESQSFGQSFGGDVSVGQL
jgi:hypothetical protein